MIPLPTADKLHRHAASASFEEAIGMTWAISLLVSFLDSYWLGATHVPGLNPNPKGPST